MVTFSIARTSDENVVLKCVKDLNLSKFLTFLESFVFFVSPSAGHFTLGLCRCFAFLNTSILESG